MNEKDCPLLVYKERERERTIGRITNSLSHEIEMVVEREFHKAVSL